MIRVRVEAHPLLRLGVFTASFPRGLGSIESPAWLVELLRDETGEARFRRDEAVRASIRSLLRHGGYRPTGRGKPASEYLVRAAGEGTLGSINVAVDACNAASLHGGLPISVVDLDLLVPPLRVAIAERGASYVFNAAGQTIDLAGLLCLHDGTGPSANAVKDSQRSKTGPDTRRVLCLIWGSRDHASRTDGVTSWYRELLERAGAATLDVLTEALATGPGPPAEPGHPEKGA